MSNELLTIASLLVLIPIDPQVESKNINKSWQTKSYNNQEKKVTW